MIDKKKAFEDWYATVEGVSALSHITAPPGPCSLTLAGRVLRIAFERGYEAVERENAALREAALKAVHTIGKALHGEGKDFRDLDHTYNLLIDLLPAEALSQGGA